MVLARMHARVHAYEVVEACSFAHLLIQEFDRQRVGPIIRSTCIKAVNFFKV